MGSFGTVVWGLDTVTGKQMAVKKVTLSESGQNSEKVEALQQEIEILSTLNHDNIVKYYGSETKDRSLNIFLEYVESKNTKIKLRWKPSFRDRKIRPPFRKIGLCLHQADSDGSGVPPLSQCHP